MTLVAGVNVGGLLAFIGDLLLSWRIPSAVDLPTQSAVHVRPGLHGDHAAGLGQKLHIIRPYLLLGWAGEHVEAVRIIRELEKLLPATQSELDDLDPAFEILNSCRDGTEMVVTVIKDGAIQTFDVRTRSFELDNKRIYLLGSGAPDFFEYLQTHPDILPSQQAANSLVAQAVLLRFAARAFTLQWILGEGLSASWGGGFEIAFPTEDGFKKIDKLLCRAWLIDAAGNYHNSGRSFFLRYYGSDLFLSCFNPNERTYVVPSHVGTPVEVPEKEQINPEWTLDMFVLAKTGSFVEFARFQPPHRPVIDRLVLTKGAVTGWHLDREYVEQRVEQALAESGRGEQFRMFRY